MNHNPDHRHVTRRSPAGFTFNAGLFPMMGSSSPGATVTVLPHAAVIAMATRSCGFFGVPRISALGCTRSSTDTVMGIVRPGFDMCRSNDLLDPLLRF